ncbi:uncharacterized protein LOC126898682 [Daktulosphaira vitifoliae]|uniref:uncharacterized protein LOC126898682 n=1 Tax=Daktulosphaira vitifoliae TaxID=58002 RepID=UPI0021AA940A|nr:uncharacterized protein LOC126898682 [Daktulosphaira vitifoliae]
MSLTRGALIGFMVLVMGAAVKAHMLFIRLALLAGMGLMGMWMLHKLAQDYQKISNGNHRPMGAAAAGHAIASTGRLLGLWKRSIPETTVESYVDDDSLHKIFKFDDILLQDRSMCARKIVCEIAATPKSQLNQVELNILKLLSPNEHYDENSAKNIFRKAMELGRRKKNTRACDLEYKKCIFNTRTMFKLFTSFM